MLLKNLETLAGGQLMIKLWSINKQQHKSQLGPIFLKNPAQRRSGLQGGGRGRGKADQ